MQQKSLAAIVLSASFLWAVGPVPNPNSGPALETNGTSFNGVSLNRIAANKLAANKLGTNAVAANKLGLNGVSINGLYAGAETPVVLVRSITLVDGTRLGAEP